MANPAHHSYTEEEKAEIARLWGEGYSKAIIAEKLGLRKGQIEGKIGDMNLPRRATLVSRATANRHSDEVRSKVTHLWAQGLSARRIGVELVLTKNQVIGLVNRMGLPRRPSPIKQGAVKPSLPKPAVVLEAPQPIAPLTPLADLMRVLALDRGPGPSFKTCQWFERENHGPFRDEDKCGRPTVSHKPYCTEHNQRAYTTRADINLGKAA